MSTIQVFEFEGRPLRSFIFRGRPCWIAQEVGAALGYTREGFTRALADWSDELIVGKDNTTLRDADLREFKAIVSLEVESTSSRAPALTILYESGVDLVCLKTEKPLGKKLRRFMADKVMPALRRGTLDTSDAARELIALNLRLAPANAETIWVLELIQELCRICKRPEWTGIGRMPPWLRGPMGLIYKVILGEIVYAELHKRNPEPRDGSLNYQFLTDPRHKLMQHDMDRVLDAAREARSGDWDGFYGKLKFKFRRAAMQLSWSGA